MFSEVHVTKREYIEITARQCVENFKEAAGSCVKVWSPHYSTINGNRVRGTLCTCNSDLCNTAAFLDSKTSLIVPNNLAEEFVLKKIFFSLPLIIIFLTLMAALIDVEIDEF